MTNNSTVLDLGKVVHATHFYRNQYGHERRLLPTHTYLNQTIHNPPSNKLHALDRWNPIVRFRLSATSFIEYTGSKADSMWKAWKGRIFSKQ